jgi:general secretion pathway protein G
MYATPTVKQSPSPFARFFRLELLVRATVIAAIAAMLLDRLLYYQEYAEKVSMDVMVHQMRSGLNYGKAQMMIAVSQGGVPTQLTDNPINLLEAPPANYAGEFAGVAPEGAGEGIWYYDLTTRELAYRPAMRRHFVAGTGCEAEARFAIVRSAAIQLNANAPKPPAWEGYALNRVRPYVWF